MEYTCSFDGCDNFYLAKGLCSGHYTQQRKGYPLAPLRADRQVRRAGVCSFDGCERPGNHVGLCQHHRSQQRKGLPLRPLQRAEYERGIGCRAAGCTRLSQKLGYCHGHYAQHRKTGEVSPLHVPTYRYRTQEGYILLRRPDHLNAQRQSGVVGEHVYVMSEMLGRPLRKGENVHHLNGVKDDNRPENLELWSTSQPKGQRVADKVAWACELLATYGDEIDQHPHALGVRPSE